jgi:hypothetical protein
MCKLYIKLPLVFWRGSEYVEKKLSFVYAYIAVGDPIIKRGGWDPMNQFNPSKFLCLSQTNV